MASTSEYWISGPIDEGSFGVVVHGKHKASGLHVAIKCMDKHTITKYPHHAQLVLQEQKLLKRFKEISNVASATTTKSSPSSSSFVINLYASFHDEMCVYLVTECCTRGSLQDLLNNGKQQQDRHSTSSSNHNHNALLIQTQTTSLVSCYGHQLIEALWYIHTKGNVIHCDIKPANILITNNGCIKLADFGSAVDVRVPTVSAPNSPLAENSNNTGSTARGPIPSSPQNDAKSRQPKQQQPVVHARGTAAYCSPELLRHTGDKNNNNSCDKTDDGITPATDLWSLGCVLYALLLHCTTTTTTTASSSSPFDCQHEAATIQAIAAYCIAGVVVPQTQTGSPVLQTTTTTTDSATTAITAEADTSAARSAMLFGTTTTGSGDDNNATLVAWRELIVGLLHPIASQRLGASDVVVASATSDTTTAPYPSILQGSPVWQHRGPTDNTIDNDNLSSMLPPVPDWWKQATSVDATYKDGKDGWSVFLV